MGTLYKASLVIMLALWLIIITVIFVVVKINFKQIYHYCWLCWYARKVPGPPSPILFLGSIFTLIGTAAEEVFTLRTGWCLKYYPIYKVSATVGFPTINICSPEDSEKILTNVKHGKSIAYNVLHNWLGTGLLTSNGEKWSSRRKMLTPGFHFKRLQVFLEVFNNEAILLSEELKNDCNKDCVEVEKILTKLTLKTMSETSMGIKLDFNNKSHVNYKNAVMELGKLLVYRAFRPWLINKYVYFFTSTRYIEQRLLKKLHDFTRNIIKEKKANFNPYKVDDEVADVYAPKKRVAMLDLLLTAQREDGSIDDDGICEEVDTFMFEGHDTTTIALSFALMLLACHKDVQDKILAEMTEVLGDIKKKPSYNDMQELKYLERCIKESLRLYPSVHFISRVLGEDIVTHSGYKLLKGTIINIHIYDLHRNPNVWPDPERFDPDRFSPENSVGRHPFAFLPFSAGPRNCIGQKFAILELKSIICSILSNFILEPIDTPESVVFVADIVLRTKNLIRVKFVPR